MLTNDLTSRFSSNEQGIVAAINDVLKSGWYVLGPHVKKFEASFANYVGSGYCISVANGTDAIELSLRAVGMTCGDRIATVANAGMYTTTALQAIGAEPFFLDVDIHTRNTTLAEVKRAIDAHARAVVVTHLYGLAVPEIQEISQLCYERNVRLIEDCAQAHGALLSDKRRVGSFGDASSFSFYPTKNLGAFGDGGAVVTNNAETAERVVRLRQYGWSTKYQVEMAGARNSRLDELQAAVLIYFLPHLDNFNARRRSIAARYSYLIHHPNVQVPSQYGSEYVAHLYVARSTRRDELRKHLQSFDIASDIHYPIPDYRQPIFGNRFSEIRLENTERLAAEVFTLPCYPEMTDDDVTRVIDAINGWQPAH